MFQHSVLGVTSYEKVSYHADAIPQLYTEVDVLFDYVDTKSRMRWKENSIYREVYSFYDTIPNVKRAIVIGFSRTDKLYELEMVDSIHNGSAWTKTTVLYLDKTHSVTTMHNQRVKRTQTFVDGKQIEHHYYADSTDKNSRVRKSVVYDVKDGNLKPELILVYSDSSLIVTRGINQLLIDFHAQAVYYFTDVGPPIAPLEYGNSQSFDSYFPYKKRTQISSEITKTEYYNFAMGSIKPFYVIWRRKDGVIVAYNQQDTQATRTVYTK